MTVVQYKADKSRGLLRVLKNFNGCKCKGCGQMGHLALKNGSCPRATDISSTIVTIEDALAEVFALGIRPEDVDRKCRNLLLQMDRQSALTALDEVKLKDFLQVTCTCHFLHVTCRTRHVACHMLHEHVACISSFSLLYVCMSDMSTVQGRFYQRYVPT